MISCSHSDLGLRWLALLGIAIAMCFGSSQVFAQEVDADRAMKSLGPAKWYNRSEDGFVPPEVNPVQDNPIRTDGWMKSKSKNQKSSGSIGTGSGWNWNGLSGLNADFLTAILTGVLVVVLVIVFGLLGYYSLRNYLPARRPEVSNVGAIKIDPAKVVDLPFEVSQPNYDNPLSEAEALMRAGKYREAIVLLFGYQLLALDQARKIELQRGKTNRRYLRELKSQVRLSQIVEQSMRVFEDAYFGKHEIEEERFLSVWQQLDEFHALASAAASGRSAGAKVRTS